MGWLEEAFWSSTKEKKQLDDFKSIFKELELEAFEWSIRQDTPHNLSYFQTWNYYFENKNNIEIQEHPNENFWKEQDKTCSELLEKYNNSEEEYDRCWKILYDYDRLSIQVNNDFDNNHPAQMMLIQLNAQRNRIASYLNKAITNARTLYQELAKYKYNRITRK